MSVTHTVYHSKCSYVILLTQSPCNAHIHICMHALTSAEAICVSKRMHYITAGCQPPPDSAMCNIGSLSVGKGSTIEWFCEITARPSTNFSLVFKKFILLPSMPGDVECGREPQVIFSVEEFPQLGCLSRYRVSVVICSANESVVGEFRILNSSGSVVIGTTVVIELIPEPTGDSVCRGGSNGHLRCH